MANQRLQGTYGSAEKFFDVVQYNAGPNSPVLQTTMTLTGNGAERKGFKFTFPVVPNPTGDPGSTLPVSFPFRFDPTWFFGDCPWGVHVYARGVSSIPLTANDLGLTTLDAGTLAGTLRFEAPYYPIKGSQNISQYPELTDWSTDADRVHSIMLLPDQNGNPPVLTIDKTLFPIGFNGPNGSSGTNFSDRGNLYMCPGAQIKVLGGKTFEVFANMFTCDLVSKGIVVEPQGNLKMSGSRIKDAEVAVHIKRGAAFRCSTTDFTNSYLHVRLDNSGSTGNDLQASFGALVQIGTTGTLKGNYPGMTTSEAPQGYGVEALQVPHLNLVSTNFFGLNNGIYADGSSITAQGRFYNIQPVGSYAPLRQGWAIYAKGTGVELIDYNGGNAFSLSDDIEDCDRAIYVNNMDATLQSIEIKANRGIYLQNCRNNKLIVSNNPKIDCKLYGIQSLLCLPTDPLSRINTNVVSISLPGNTLTTGRGITLQEIYGVTDPNGIGGWRVWNNNIGLERGYTGIRYSGSDNSGFWDNHVTLLDKTYNHYVGFDLQSSKKLTLNCNEVGPPDGDSGDYGSNSTGYRISNVSQTSYTGNQTARTLRGMTFSNRCEASTLRANQFQFHTQGLTLAANVALGEQGKDFADANGNVVNVQDHGNCWTNSSAFHAATDQDVVRLSAFGVDPAEMACFLPPNNQGSIWFSQEITPTQPSYTLNASSCNPPINPASIPGGGKLDKAVADGSIATAGLPGVTTKMLENHLYARLMEDGALANEPPFKEFVAIKGGTTTENFYLIRRGIDGLANRSAAQRAMAAAARSNIAAERRELFILDSLKALDKAISPEDYTQAIQDLSQLTTAFRQQLAEVQTQKLQQANQLLTQNSAVAVSAGWEINEKLVNELAIRMFLQDHALSAAQLGQLDNLAALCPDNEGEAVLRARILYNLFVEKEYEHICERSANQTAVAPARSIQVWPNPTTGRIFLPEARGAMRDLQVFDLTGREVFHKTTDNTVIDLGILPNGLYQLRIFNQASSRLETAKVVISQ